MTIDSPPTITIDRPSRSTPASELVRLEHELAIHARLTEARALLAHTQRICLGLVEAARDEADEIVDAALASAHRIADQANARHTGIDRRARSAFSELWDSSFDDEATGLDTFFSDMVERAPEDVFRR